MTLPGWYPYLVYCNGLVIASFQTPHLRDVFIRERQKKYPKNKYSDRPLYMA